MEIKGIIFLGALKFASDVCIIKEENTQDNMQEHGVFLWENVNRLLK